MATFEQFHPTKKIKMQEAEVSRSIREEPPTHFQLKIESFSLLASSSLTEYYSDDFQAGGYKWKLCLYPNGNKEQNGEGHISLYLEMVVTDSLPPGWEVHALFRLFVLDQLRDNYLTLEEGIGRTKRFRATKTYHGFDRLITLEQFLDPKNGYMVKDVCVFGAEVFVHKENVTAKVERLLMTAVAVDCIYTWKINKFSELVQQCHSSDIFTAAGHKWNILIYPKGCGKGKGKSLSLFLQFNDSTKLLPAQGVYAKYQFSIMDQINGKDVEKTSSLNWFNSKNISWGWENFLVLSSLEDESKGYLVKDVFIIEANIQLTGAKGSSF